MRKNLRKLVSWAPSTVVRMTYHPGSLNLLEKVEPGRRWTLLSPAMEADWRGYEDELREKTRRLGVDAPFKN